MKLLSLTIIALSLTLGACAHHDNAPASSSYSSTTSTGYSK
ncbi:MAG: hypothetical protein WCF18_11085 [Chthoniobacteraceae bacterium]